MDNFNVDAYKPKEIADRIEQISVSKSATDPLRVFAWLYCRGIYRLCSCFFYGGDAWL